MLPVHLAQLRTKLTERTRSPAVEPAQADAWATAALGPSICLCDRTEFLFWGPFHMFARTGAQAEDRSRPGTHLLLFLALPALFGLVLPGAYAPRGAHPRGLSRVLSRLYLDDGMSIRNR